MKIKNIIAATVFAASLCGSSDLLAQSKPMYTPSKPTYAPSKPAYIAPKREPLYKETPRDRRTRTDGNAWAGQQNRRNGY